MHAFQFQAWAYRHSYLWSRKCLEFQIFRTLRILFSILEHLRGLGGGTFNLFKRPLVVRAHHSQSGEHIKPRAACAWISVDLHYLWLEPLWVVQS